MPLLDVYVSADSYSEYVKFVVHSASRSIHATAYPIRSALPHNHYLSASTRWSTSTIEHYPTSTPPTNKRNLDTT